MREANLEEVVKPAMGKKQASGSQAWEQSDESRGKLPLRRNPDHRR